MAELYCEHQHLNGACEDCAYEAAEADGLPLSGPHPSVTRERNAQAVRPVGAGVVDSHESTKPARTRTAQRQAKAD